MTKSQNPVLEKESTNLFNGLNFKCYENSYKFNVKGNNFAENVFNKT